MARSIIDRRRLRKDYGKIKEILEGYRAGKAVDFRTLPYTTNDFRKYQQGVNHAGKKTYQKSCF